ncbi:hypothetical protein HDU88_003433 [Geranomyces variabilis]|nr:hypothetical protein HDU88_003433 [Geranomyces variabilis]
MTASERLAATHARRIPPPSPNPGHTAGATRPSHYVPTLEKAMAIFRKIDSSLAEKYLRSALETAAGNGDAWLVEFLLGHGVKPIWQTLRAAKENPDRPISQRLAKMLIAAGAPQWI